jgi:ABC-type transport system involved in multi-copper enzyme maturation permease subunit
MTPLAIASITLKEALRDKLLHVAALFGALMIGFTLLLGGLSAGQDLKIIQDFGLGAINALLILLAIFLGSRLISRDLEQRIVYTLLSKPITRGQFLTGKFLGCAGALWLLLGLLGLLFYALMALVTRQFHPIFLGPLVLFGLEAMVMLGLTLLFTTMTSPMLSILYSMGFYALGHGSELIKQFGEKADPLGKALSLVIYYALPNLETFNAKNQAVYGESLAAGQWIWAIAYGTCLIVVLLTLANLVFARKELP